MTEWHWAEVKEQAILAFGGELPRAETEADVIDAFERRPASVVAAVGEVAAAKRDGRARSGWAVLRARVLDGGTRDVVVTDEGERDRVEALAFAWVRNAGVYFDREDEIVAELFGSEELPAAGKLASRLAPFNSPGLRGRLLEVWRERRPAGERAEFEAEERARKFNEQRMSC